MKQDIEAGGDLTAVPRRRPAESAPCETQGSKAKVRRSQRFTNDRLEPFLTRESEKCSLLRIAAPEQSYYAPDIQMEIAELVKDTSTELPKKLLLCVATSQSVVLLKKAILGWRTQTGIATWQLSKSASKAEAFQIIENMNQDMMCLSLLRRYYILRLFEQLVVAGANINHIDIYGQTPLYLAAWRGRDESVRQLLQAKPDTSISAEITGLTALSIAAFEGNSAIVKQLIKAGADIHHTNATDNTPLMLAVSVGHIATVRELLHAGAKPTGCGTNREKALAWATERGDIDMVRILIEAGANVQSTHPDGRNALSFAAQRGHIEICKVLVQAGSEIDSVDMLGRTALSWAAEHGSIDQFIYLWQLDPQLGQTDRFGRSPLSWAAEKGHNDIISFIISQRAPLDITHKGNWDVELISDAIRKLHPSTFKLLPPFRSPWQFRREDAATLQRPACNPLGIAVAQGHAQAVKTLLDAGAATDIKDITGFTPLMLAAKRGDLHVVSLLVSAGASLDRKCQRGWDAAKLASASGHRYVAFYLNSERGRMRYTSP
jgi:ankyrin repeat protein